MEQRVLCFVEEGDVLLEPVNSCGEGKGGGKARNGRNADFYSFSLSATTYRASNGKTTGTIVTSGFYALALADIKAEASPLPSSTPRSLGSFPLRKRSLLTIYSRSLSIRR